jgi:hypothetical protein
MKTVEISDELYEELKAFVIDPFDDTAELVIGRLVQIASKAKEKWSPFEACENMTPHEPTMAERTRISYEEAQTAYQSQVVL